MCHQLHSRFFEELLGLDPQEVCRRALCDHDAETGCYRVTAFGTGWLVDPRRERVIAEEEGAEGPSLELGLALVFYLLGAKDEPISGEWVSEKDFPGGTAFFRGPHAIPSHLVAEKFGGDREGFKRACLALAGRPLDMADAAFSFRALPRVPLAALLWVADEEFPAEARVLFDRSLSLHLPLDVIFGLAEEFCHRLCGRRESPSWY